MSRRRALRAGRLGRRARSGDSITGSESPARSSGPPVLRTRSGPLVLARLPPAGILNGTPVTMQLDPRYADVVAEVAAFLAERAGAARAAGVAADAIVVDPGIGFGKTVAHNCALLARLDLVASLGYPVLVGVSRKGFIGQLLGERPTSERLLGTATAVALAVAKGARLVRVHEVGAMRDVARVAEAVVGA